MTDRTTAKNDIVTLNGPSVTNAIMTQMLNDKICDNVVFRKDLTVAQASGLSNITVDFTGKDRVDLTRTGGNLVITLAGIEDGETKFLLITKTVGQPITWVGVTDITSYKTLINAAPVVLYEIVRKGAYYFAKAWYETVVAASETYAGIVAKATAAECNALSITNKFVTPGTVPLATSTQKGLIEIATGAEVDLLTSTDLAVTPGTLPKASAAKQGIAQYADNTQTDAGTDSPTAGLQLVIPPSQLKRKYDAALALVGIKIYWYGRFVKASNTLTKYAGPGEVTFGTDFGAGHYQLLTTEVLNKQTAIVNVLPFDSSAVESITSVQFENNLTNGLLTVKATGDTDLLITIFKLN